MDPHSRHKALLAPLRAAMYDFAEPDVRGAMDALLAPDAVVRLAFPFGEMVGTDALL